jgi:MoaA/NifB/PqqE/SkfB family radical SAM enzyme
MLDKYSNYKLLGHSDKLDALKSKKTSAPIYVRLKPVNFCNHDCFFCVYAKTARKSPSGNVIDHIDSGMHSDIDLTDAIPGSKLLEICQDLVEMGVKAVTFSGGGEPLLHPQINDAMEILLNGGIAISAITNGQLLAKSSSQHLLRSSWVRVSIDYSSPDEMASSRNVPPAYFYEVLDSIEYFSSNKSNETDLFVNYIVHKSNSSNLLEISRQLKDRGVENIRFSPMWVPDYIDYHAEFSDHVRSQILQIKQVLEDSSFSVSSTYNLSLSEHTTERSYSRCFIMETVPVIGADLNVYACHNKAYDKTGIICSIRDSSFKEAWFSDQTRDFFDNFDAGQICKHQCSNDSKNIALHSIFNTSYDPFI